MDEHEKAAFLRKIAQLEREAHTEKLQAILQEVKASAGRLESEQTDPVTFVASKIVEIYGPEAIEIATILEERNEDKEFPRAVRLCVEMILSAN